MRRARVPLDRHQDIARIWDWLPAFRAAAEYESLQRAGLAIAVSPSALSRSIKLLEEALEVPLFVRTPSGLTLTEAGQRLLVATREAMRRVHDGLATTGNQRLRAGASGSVLSSVLCDAAVEALPSWSLHFSQVEQHAAAEKLRCGELDVAVLHEPLNAEDLCCQPLPALQFVLAAAPGGSRERLVSLDLKGVTLPVATVTVATVEHLVSVTERLQASACVPTNLVPPNWERLEPGPSVPVFFVSRVYPAPPAFEVPLLSSLHGRLS